MHLCFTLPFINPSIILQSPHESYIFNTLNVVLSVFEVWILFILNVLSRTCYDRGYTRSSCIADNTAFGVVWFSACLVIKQAHFLKLFILLMQITQ